MKKDTVIKVLSLGIGLAVGTVLIAKVCFESSYDSFYKDIDRVYWIESSFKQPGSDQFQAFQNVSGAIAPGYKKEVPGVEEATRTTGLFETNQYIDEDANIIEGSLELADSCFFNVFDRPILAGDPVKVLGEPYALMVSRSFAEKLGGVEQSIGKILKNKNYSSVEMTIKGVFEDFPKNGSLDYDLLLSLETYSKASRENWVGNDRYRGYVKLMEGVDPRSLKDAVRKMQETHQDITAWEEKGVRLEYNLRPFDKMHTSDPTLRTTLIILSVVAGLLIIISLLNYILIVISSVVKRSKEIGVRKCYGAGTAEIYKMLSKEGLLHVVMALILAAAIIFASRGVIRDMLGVPFETLLVPQSLVVIGTIVVLVLAVSIVVPSKIHLSIPVYAALKNYSDRSRNWKLGLLGLQVMINIFLISMIFVIAAQYKFASTAHPGYDYDRILYTTIYNSDKHNIRLRVVNELRNYPGVEQVEASYDIPLHYSSGDNVYIPGDDRELFNVADQYEATKGFYELFNIPFLEGRAPEKDGEMAVSQSFVKKINEFVDWSDGIIGRSVYVTGGHTQDGDVITGVYPDIIIGNLVYTDSRPSVRFYKSLEDSTAYMPYILIKVNEIDDNTISELQSFIKSVNGGEDWEVRSYATQFVSSYSESLYMRNTIIIGAIVSVLIAILGLIGFANDESQRRRKEMALRKINGASLNDILRRFSGSIVKLSLVSAVIASVAAYLVSGRWLEQFSQKIDISPLYFIGSTGVVLVIVTIIVTVNCYRVATANPINYLRNE